jgi:hypothetical protein
MASTNKGAVTRAGENVRTTDEQTRGKPRALDTRNQCPGNNRTESKQISGVKRRRSGAPRKRPINPRSPRGERPSHSRIANTAFMFQSTLPARGATCERT